MHHQRGRRILCVLGLAYALTACTTGPGGAKPGSGDDGEATSTGRPPAGTAAGSTTVFPVIDRAAHTATLLPDGRVLVVGGCVVDGCGEATPTTELFDPATGAFVTGPRMADPRAGHTASALPGGDVLVVGGYAGEGSAPLDTAEVYDATSETFRPAGTAVTGRGAHAAAVLHDGRVLVVGGWAESGPFVGSAEIWDPQTDSFGPAGALAVGRAGPSATVLADGHVLVAGGEDTPAYGLGSSELYDPATATWTAGPDLTEPRFKHAAVFVGGAAYLIGGTPDDDRLLATVERYDDAAGRFVPAGTLREGRYKFGDAVVGLPDGRIVVAGGGWTVEVFDVGTGTSELQPARIGGRASFATATALRDGEVLVVGGYDDRIDLRRSALVLAAPEA